MPRDPKSRDLTLNSLALLTGGLTAAAFVGTGWVTGLASDYTPAQFQAAALTYLAQGDAGKAAASLNQAIELAPGYVDVAIERWAALTGLEPVLDMGDRS